MTPESLHDFFLGSAGVAGALIGLLFVAISVEHDRLTAPDADQVHRVRASAALISFTNALTVSLFALIPGDLGGTLIAVGIAGLGFVGGSVVSVYRVGHFHPTRTARLRNLTFLVALLAIFVFQIVNGLRLDADPHNGGAAQTTATLVIVCFLIGVYRAWELIGGPSIGFRHEVRELVRDAGANAEKSRSGEDRHGG